MAPRRLVHNLLRGHETGKRPKKCMSRRGALFFRATCHSSLSLANSRTRLNGKMTASSKKDLAHFRRWKWRRFMEGTCKTKHTWWMKRRSSHLQWIQVWTFPPIWNLVISFSDSPWSLSLAPHPLNFPYYTNKRSISLFKQEIPNTSVYCSTGIVFALTARWCFSVLTGWTERQTDKTTTQ